jgi:predicted outer membrane repeat protein
MQLFAWLRQPVDGRRHRAPSHKPHPAYRFRPWLEALEDRCLPSTLTVLNNADSGTGSLRAEIAAAPNGATIVFASSMAGQTITLTSDELVIAKSLKIQGPGAGQLTISGGGTWRVFEVDARASVTLSGLTITQGDGVAGTINDNEGGGVLNFGNLTISNSTLSGNGATFGGGIYNAGTLLVSSSLLSGNFAIPGYITGWGSVRGGLLYGVGGGIYNASKATVSNSTLSGNWATYGGGIENYSGASLTVTGSSLLNNSAVPDPYDGSGGSGGGLDNAGKTIVQSSTVSGNSAAVGGGGIYNDLYASLTLSGSTVTGNGAPAGADIYNLGSLTLKKSTVGVIGP